MNAGKRNLHARGFILLDVLLLSLFLMALLGNIQLYAKAAVMSQVNGVRTMAVYLAREEFSYLQKHMAEGSIPFHAQKLGWLGEPSALMENHGNCRVEAVLQPVKEGRCPVISAEVTVYWQTGGHEGKISFERTLCEVNSGAS